MTDTNTRSKKRTPKEIDPATPSASASRKARKRTPEQKEAAAEATRRNKANRVSKKTVMEKKAKTWGLSPDHDEVNAHALDKARSENSVTRSEERTPTNARNLLNDWRFESASSNISFPKNPSAATEQRVESKGEKEARDDTALPLRRNARGSALSPSWIHRCLQARPYSPRTRPQNKRRMRKKSQPETNTNALVEENSWPDALKRRTIERSTHGARTRARNTRRILIENLTSASPNKPAYN